MITYAILAPRHSWLVYLLDGWQLPFVVEPERSGYSIILTRDDAP